MVNHSETTFYFEHPKEFDKWKIEDEANFQYACRHMSWLFPNVNRTLSNYKKWKASRGFRKWLRVMLKRFLCIKV